MSFLYSFFEKGPLKIKEYSLEVEHHKYIGIKYTTTGISEAYNRNCLCTVHFTNFANEVNAIEEAISSEARLENGNLRNIALKWFGALTGNLSTVNPDNFTNILLVLNDLGIVQLMNDKKFEELATKDKTFDSILLSDASWPQEQKDKFTARSHQVSLLSEKDPEFPIEATWNRGVQKKIVNLICAYHPNQKLPQAFNAASLALQSGVALFALYSFYQLYLKK